MDGVVGGAGDEVEDEGDANARHGQDEPEAECVQTNLDADGETG